ncbi:MAG: carbohydrate porin, partial [Symploca sp. SIO2B6]|nr:carbohydrate porin [Symploca sp. SIO2B6]
MEGLWRRQTQHQEKSTFPKSRAWGYLRVVGLLSTGMVWASMDNPVYANADSKFISISPTVGTASEWHEVEQSYSIDSINSINSIDRTDNIDSTHWMTQVTPVSELSDVLPTDWAYEAVRSLSDRYNIPLGFPDGAYRGNRALTRYEFAAVMIPVLEQVAQTIVDQDANWMSNADLQLVERLQSDFEEAIAKVRGRVESIDGSTQQLEQQQFSITTLLDGEVVAAISDQLGSNRAGSAVIQHRLSLDWVTHFSGRDALHTRLMASDGAPLGAAPDGNTSEGTFIHNSRGQTDGEVVVDWLGYQIALGDRPTPDANLAISATGGTHSHYLDTISPWGTGFDGNGSLSVFSQASPIYTIGGGIGVGGEWTFAPKGRIALSAGYLAEGTAHPMTGLFDQDYAALAQVTLRPTSNITLGATYVHGYHTPGSGIFDAGLGEAIAGTGIANVTHSQLDTPATTNSYGLQAMVDVNDVISLFGFGGYTNVQFINHGEGDIWYYGAGLALRNWLIPQTSGG